MENYIMLDGRKFEVSGSLAELLRGVVEDKEEETPFELNPGKPYYYISDEGSIATDTDYNRIRDFYRYENGNYCADKELMRQQNLREILNRLIWRHREIWDRDEPWDGHHQHWYIVNRKDEFTVEFTMTHHIPGVVYFSLCDNAVNALEKIVKPFMCKHPDFVW